MADTSIFNVTGPGILAVGLGTSNALQKLGWSQGGIMVSETLLERPVQADYCGPEMPADVLVLGKVLVISLRLVRFDPAVLAVLKGRFYGGVAGAIQANEVGSLVLAEGKSFPLKIKYPYQAKAVFSGCEAGLHVANAYLASNVDTRVATEEQGYNLTFKAILNMNTTTLSGTLWDNDMTGFPA